ncbi:Filamentous hemagglutinin [Labeo rohita]|uniref:Filamentous hemagglutinin n=1 Tax=Labeo rohita TaxID=84645 RepID=A0ABQ8MB28_LABRO|nr:Filamentous hemagglutinin [Labeo rohita]
MSQRQTSPSEDDFDFPPAGPRTVPLPHVAPSEPQALSRGRRSARTATRRPRRLGLPSPPPARTPADSTASSYRSVRPTIPRIEKKTMARQTSATAQPSTVAPPAAQVSDWPLPLPIPAPPPVSFSSRLTAQTPLRCLPRPTRSSQLKRALGRTGRHSQPRLPPTLARGLQPKRALGRTGRHTQPRLPLSLARRSQPNHPTEIIRSAFPIAQAVPRRTPLSARAPKFRHVHHYPRPPLHLAPPYLRTIRSYLCQLQGVLPRLLVHVSVAPPSAGLPQSSALPLMVAAYLWGSEWASKSILMHCDNAAAVQCINKGRFHSPILTLLKFKMLAPEVD